uniref:Phosphoprotein n=1 Tax=Rocahepevirus ratti TaxID=1678145 RepID=A0A410U927_9VIRU|nr:phosphoprotein [Rocahepevirus ratti]
MCAKCVSLSCSCFCCSCRCCSRPPCTPAESGVLVGPDAARGPTRPCLTQPHPSNSELIGCPQPIPLLPSSPPCHHSAPLGLTGVAAGPVTGLPSYPMPGSRQ